MTREDFRSKLLQCLGGDWPEPCPLQPEILYTIPRDGYRIEKVRYLVEPGENVSAFLLVPDHATPSHPASGLAVWHQHCNMWTIGKSEPAGLIGDPAHFTGVSLVKEGDDVLCPDASNRGSFA